MIMGIERKKPYKANDPRDTILKVRRILHRELGILLKEEHFQGDNEFYSCRITIANNNIGDLGIGTNGKGMTFEYALASAYGEFMERIQNQALIFNRHLGNKYLIDSKSKSELLAILTKKGALLNYFFAPDEELITYDSSKRELLKQCINKSELDMADRHYIGRLIPMVPYVNVTNSVIEKLPASLIFANCTSNGMCAGNTPFEAIIQGLCEILERYILRRIYYENLSFPTIPLDYFKGSSIYYKINKLKQKHDWDFLIKDCSCGINMPAVGILILDKNNCRYKFHLGVDPSLITALERSITETYQGRSSVCFQDLDWETQNRLLNDPQLKELELSKTCTRGVGQYPISLLCSAPSFPLSHIDEDWGVSDESDLKKLFGVFKVLDHPIFIRDVSFLKFPAYSIYVPGISCPKGLPLSDNASFGYTSNMGASYLNLERTDKNHLKNIIQHFEQSPRGVKTVNFYNTADFWSSYNQSLILSLLNYSVGNYSKANEHFDAFMATSNFDTTQETIFFKCIQGILYNKANGIKCESSVFFDNDVYESALMFLESKHYLEFMKHSNCDSCGSCGIRNSCRLVDALVLAKRIEKVYEQNQPKQEDLLKLFKTL